MRELALRLLAASQTVSGARIDEAVLVSDKLRISLTRFAGVDGFASLQRRALVLARAEVPSLHSVKVGADGRLEGFEQQKSGEWRVASDEERSDEWRVASGEKAESIPDLTTHHSPLATPVSPLITHHSPLTTSSEGAAAIIAQLLGLLVTFIGQPLTLTLLADAWPNISLDEWDSRTKVKQ